MAALQDHRALAWQRGYVFERLAATEVEASPGGAIEIATKWADWAMARGDARRAADAWAVWMTAVTALLRRHVLDDKLRRLSRVQALVSVAAEGL